jgi:hypothetical protein
VSLIDEWLTVAITTRNIALSRRQFYKKQKRCGRLKCAPTGCRAG